MNVEDSYEGAVRRLQRLEMAGAVEEAAVDDHAERMRQLEELALLACEDNERLKREFGAALQELDDTRKELDGARAEVERAQRELGGARREIEELRACIASLQQAASTPPAPAFVPQQAFVAPPEPFAEAFPEEDFGYPPKSRKGAFYFFVLAIAGAAVAALCVMRPWDRPHAPAIVVEQPAPQPPPVVTAPPPAPKIAPTVPKIEPTVPKVARAAVAAPKAATKPHPARKHAKHHAAKKHGAATARATAPDASDDPLAGTGL